MNEHLKHLIKAMRRGWKLLPNNAAPGSSFGFIYLDKGAWGSELKQITGACPIIHAVLGELNVRYFYHLDILKLDNAARFFSILRTQRVQNPDGGDPEDLLGSIVRLRDVYKWTTPEIIKWLQSHLKD